LKFVKVHEGRLLYQNPETIVFVPTSLLTDLFKKEYEAVKEMHSLEQIDIDYQKSHQHEMFSPMKVNNNRNQKENEHQEQEGTSGNLLMNFIGKFNKEK
jgi:phosphotransferase system IIA component